MDFWIPSFCLSSGLDKSTPTKDLVFLLGQENIGKFFLMQTVLFW
jgi:hypothetical protein